MTATVSEVKNRLSHYIDLSKEQPIAITRHGRVVARLVSEQPSKQYAVERLLNMPKHEFSYDDARMKKYLS
jgi:prevent-host-death family protein